MRKCSLSDSLMLALTNAYPGSVTGVKLFAIVPRLFPTMATIRGSHAT